MKVIIFSVFAILYALVSVFASFYGKYDAAYAAFICSTIWLVGGIIYRKP